MSEYFRLFNEEDVSISVSTPGLFILSKPVELMAVTTIKNNDW